MDAANIDLKGFDEEFYRVETGGSLKAVQRFLTQAAGRVHLEVTTLVIPGKNDDRRRLKALRGSSRHSARTSPCTSPLTTPTTSTAFRPRPQHQSMNLQRLRGATCALSTLATWRRRNATPCARPAGTFS